MKKYLATVLEMLLCLSLLAVSIIFRINNYTVAALISFIVTAIMALSTVISCVEIYESMID